MTVVYTDLQSVVTELNLQQQQDNPTSYLLYAIPTSQDIINYYVNQANNYTLSLFGDLSSDPTRFSLAKMYATKLASLWIVQNTASNIIFSGIRMGVGAISVDRLPAIESAFEKLQASLRDQLTRLYNLLSSIETVDSYRPSSPYIVSKGQSWMP